jgi:dihydrofolate reductase
MFMTSVGADGSTSCTAPSLPLAFSSNEPVINGLSVRLSNGTNGASAFTAQQDGVGPAVTAKATGGSGVVASTQSISSAAVLGDSNRGEVIVGRGGSGCTDIVLSNCTGIGAVVGRNDGPGGIGVRGFTVANGSNYKGIGVLGQSGISGGNGVAVRGENVNAANASNAVEAITNGAGSALYAQGAQAGTFNGAVTINGNLTVTGTKSGFHIDDPRSPTTRTLTHTPLETDALMVQYTGNVRTDAHGRATVKLPSYAGTLAGDWRYQLTPIGTFDEVIVGSEVKDNAFTIRSRHGGTKVSWTVTGVRHDPQARADGITPVQAKRGADRGRYIDPKLYGKPAAAARARTAATARTTARLPLGSVPFPRRNPMRSVVCTMGVSLDGYITGPDGDFNWRDPDPELFRFVTAQTRELSAYVMGRRLYETMLYWETADTASTLSTEDTRAWVAAWRPLPKVVFSTTLTAVEGNARLATSGLAEEIARLRAAPGGGDIAIGGATLAAEAARLGLIDEYQPRVFPVVVGGGLPFYPRSEPRMDLELVESRVFGSEIVWSRYRVAR